MKLVDADKARECFGGDGVTGAVMQRMFDKTKRHQRSLRGHSGCGHVPEVFGYGGLHPRRGGRTA